MVIVTVTDTVTDRRAVPKALGKKAKGPGKECPVLGHRSPCAFMDQCGFHLDPRV